MIMESKITATAIYVLAIYYADVSNSKMQYDFNITSYTYGNRK